MMRIFTALLIFVAFASSDGFADEVKRLDASDLRVETHKWDGKKIEAKFNCFYADKNEFRCVAGRARVDFEKFSDAKAQEIIENDCDTIKKSALKKCLFTIQFVYDSFSSHQMDFNQKLLVITAKDNVGEIILNPKK